MFGLWAAQHPQASNKAEAQQDFRRIMAAIIGDSLKMGVTSRSEAITFRSLDNPAHEDYVERIPMKIHLTMVLALCGGAMLPAGLLAGQAAGAPNAAQQGAAGNSAAAPGNPLDQLTSEQKQKFEESFRLFQEQSYGDALAIDKQLLAAVPANTPAHVLIAKFAAEAALDTGDNSFALGALQPIEAANANDWQAAALLARAYAEAGDKAQRDAELAHLVDLHKRAVDPQIAQLTQIPLETIPFTKGTGSAAVKGTIRVFYSLEPWGNFNIYLMARIYDQAGKQIYRVTLESDDMDQVFFKRDHPDLAAKGERRFSLDGYGPDIQLPNGQMTQDHATYGFFDGKPDYDTYRARVIEIAEGTETPMSQTTHGSKP